MKTLKSLHNYYFTGIVLFTFVFFLPFYLILIWFPVCYPIVNRLRKLQCYLICYLGGFIPIIKHLSSAVTHERIIYCANHTSNLDILFMCLVAKGNFHFMGKIELLENPILKLFFTTIDIPVDRKSIKSSFQSFKKANERIENGMSLVIFPEGKIPDDYPPILDEFKNGPFRMAIENKVAIVPVSFQNIWERMWDDGHKYGTSPGKCFIFVHEKIETQNLSIQDTESLKEKVYQKIKSKL